MKRKQKLESIRELQPLPKLTETLKKHAIDLDKVMQESNALDLASFVVIENTIRKINDHFRRPA